MNAILEALMDLAQRGGRFTEAKANELSNRPWVLLLIAFAVCSVGLAMNLLGYKWPSLVLAIVYGIVAIYQWKNLYRLGIVTGAGFVASLITRTPHEKSIETALKLYVRCFLWVLLVPETFLLITGKVFVAGNIEHILAAIVGICVFTLMVTMWPKVFPGNMGKKSVYYYAVAIIVLSFGSLIPGPVWVKYMPYGWDPSTAKPTSTEESLYRLDHTRQEMADTDRATELERITKKIESREALTQAEERFIVEAQQSQSKRPPVSKQAGAEIPLASSPQSTWPKLVIPPGIGSESELIHVPPGTQLSVAGYKFQLYNVYQDKTRCAYGNDCKIAPLAGAIAVNESADENILHYAYSKT